MSINPADFYKWLKVFGVETGGGGGVVYPITMDKGGTGANLTATANALFYSTATEGALLATPASSVLGSDGVGALTWSQTLPSGTQAVSPSTANMVATKAYVDAVAAGLNPAQAVDAATVSPLTGYTYNNGVSGVGATLTAGSNGVFQIDGITVPINEPILYKNDVAGGGAWNGVYIVTDPGSVSTPAILTRAVYYDDPDNINNTGIIPVILGDVNQQSAWLLVSTVTAVGTSPLTYIQFGQTAGIIPLDKGGTNNNITPSAGGIVYSEALWLDVIAGTPTAGLPLLSGSSAAPTWGAFPISLAGALTTAGAVGFSGAFSFAATLTGNTAVTFPVSGTLATVGQLPGGAALSTANDTNVTLSLGGTPLTALLQAASITAGWTGLLSVPRGGTGLGSATAYGVICGGTTSTGAFQSVASLGTAGQALLSNGAGLLPSFGSVIRAVSIQTFASGSAAYSPSSGTFFCDVYVTAGGGGGGGSGGGTNPQAAAGGGGGAGGTSILYGVPVATVTGQTVTVGSGGAGGTAGANNGSAGGASSVGAIVTTNGGAGGVGRASVSGAGIPTPGGAGGAAGSGGSVNITGGGGGFSVSTGTSASALSGSGGVSFWGGGAISPTSPGTGVSGTTYGTGGSGGLSTTSNAAGGAGQNGLVVIVEYKAV